MLGCPTEKVKSEAEASYRYQYAPIRPERALRGHLNGFQKPRQSHQRAGPWLRSRKPNTWILYLDANNRYGCAMQQRLLVEGFRWADSTIDEVLATPDDALKDL